MQPWFRQCTEEWGETMGMLFNTPDTHQIVDKLNHQYDDQPHGLQQNHGDAGVYLDFVNYPNLPAVANRLGLLPGNGQADARWLWFLKFIDTLPGPNTTIGVDLRNAIAAACNGYPNCVAIEFFAVPDTSVSLNVGNIGYTNGTYSAVITLFTLLIDRLGNAPYPKY
jgi:hypothetical protein